MDIPPPSVEMGKLSKKWGGKEKWLGSGLPASFGNYRLAEKKARYGPNIEGGMFTHEVFKYSRRPQGLVSN